MSPPPATPSPLPGRSGDASSASTSGRRGDQPLPAPRHATGAYRVLAVCLGNICRSPMAEVVLRDRLEAQGLAHRVEVTSAGTGSWHVGDRANQPARNALRRRGLDGDRHRARQVDAAAVLDADLVLAMDDANMADLRRLVPADAQADTLPRLRLLRSFEPDGGGPVPDPYGGTAADFDDVLDMIVAAVDALLPALRDAVRSAPGRAPS
jgi:protein-tyrosine phosphatase